MWRPEKGVVSVTGSIQLPAEFVVSSKENMTMGLWFPDPSSSLRNNTRLSIQLVESSSAGAGWWDGNLGVNMLPHQINITENRETCLPISYSFVT
jgi:hypothetical protein